MTLPCSLESNDQSMRSTSPFDAANILDGIRQWVEIETPAEAMPRVRLLYRLYQTLR